MASLFVAIVILFIVAIIRSFVDEEDETDDSGYYIDPNLDKYKDSSHQ